MQMLLTSAPVLIEAKAARTFLEAAQQTAGELFGALRTRAGDETADIGARVDAALARLQDAAAPVVVKLNREERAAVTTDDGEPERV